MEIYHRACLMVERVQRKTHKKGKENFRCTISVLGKAEPLILAYFFQPRRENSFPLYFAEFENKISTRRTLLRRKRYQTKLLKQLWIKQKEQYLLNLSSIYQIKSPGRHKNSKILDVVLVDGTAKSKLLWDLGVVKAVKARINLFVKSIIFV